MLVLTIDKVLNKLAFYIGKVPLAGGLFAYLFKKTGDGIVVITTTANKLVNSAGDMINHLLYGTRDLTVVILNTTTRATNKVVGTTMNATKNVVGNYS